MALTYDIFFHSNTSVDNKGFHISLQDAKDYIKTHNGTDHSYFADYKGGNVCIVCNQTDEEVYSEIIK